MHIGKTLFCSAFLLSIAACSTGTTTTGLLATPTEIDPNRVETQVPVTPTTPVSPVAPTTPVSPVTPVQPVDPTQSVVSANSIINGATSDAFVTFWRCEVIPDPTQDWVMVFAADATGAYITNTRELPFTWMLTGTTINMVFENDNRDIAYSNIQFSSQGIFTTSFDITFAASDPTSCELKDFSTGEPVY